MTPEKTNSNHAPGRSFWKEQPPSWLHLRVLIPGAIILLGIALAGFLTRGTLNGVTARINGKRVTVQLCDRGGVLYGEALYGARLTGRRVTTALASLAPEAGKLPQLEPTAIRRAFVVVEHGPDLIRFVLIEQQQEITYDGNRFRLTDMAANQLAAN